MANKTQFDDDEYAIVVLQGLRRMIKRSDYYIGFVPARSIMKDTADAGEVGEAIQHAITAIRERWAVRDATVSEKPKRMYED